MFRRNRFRISALVLLFPFGYAIFYCSQALPIAAGYGAKIMCSAVFVSGREEKDVKAEDLNFFPLTLASFVVNSPDSSVSCSMFGVAKSRAIYRPRLGATLVNDFSEAEIRAQPNGVPAPGPVNTDSLPWPGGDATPGTEAPGIDSALVMAAVDRVFAHKEKAFTNITRALLVLYDGQIVAERYAAGITRETKLPGWSMAKSVTGALTGILVKQGKLALDKPAQVPEWNPDEDPRHQITLKNLLQQASGLDFEEVYDKPSNANRMLFTKGDAAAYAASQQLAWPPGTHFRYSSGNSNILSRICRQTIGEAHYQAFPYRELFYKLGMYHTVLEPDASGTFVGSSFCYATLRDWARFGLLYLDNGNWQGEQILPPDWVRLTTTPSTTSPGTEYGFQWWLNAGGKYPAIPADMYYADGYEGQNIFIIPSRKLVVVRLGLTRSHYWGEHAFLQSVIAAINE